MGSMTIGSGGFGNALGYGDTGGGDGSVGGGESVEAAIANAMMLADDYTQACGYELRKQNEAGSVNTQKLRKISDAKALVEELIGLFPAPTKDDKNTNPTLNQLGKIYEDRRTKDELPIEERYDSGKTTETVDHLNQILTSLGFPEVDQTKDTKSTLEALKTRLQGMQDELSAGNSQLQNKVGLLVGYVNAGQTAQQGLTKTKISMVQGWARIPGSA